MPACAVHQYDTMAAFGDMETDLFEVPLHGVGIYSRQHKTSALAVHRADGAKEISVLIALIRRQPWPGPFPCPDARPTVLLADTGLVLKPHLNLPAFRQMAYVGFERASKVFLKASIT